MPPRPERKAFSSDFALEMDGLGAKCFQGQLEIFLLRKLVGNGWTQLLQKINYKSTDRRPQRDPHVFCRSVIEVRPDFSIQKVHSFRWRSRLAWSHETASSAPRDSSQNRRFLALAIRIGSCSHAQWTQRHHIALAMSQSRCRSFRPRATNTSCTRCHVTKFC